MIVSTKSSEVNSHGPAGDSTDPSVIAFSTPSSPHKVRATIETVKLSSLIPSSTLIETGDPDTCYALIERIIAAESTAFAAQVSVPSARSHPTLPNLSACQILSEIKPIFLRVLEPEISAKCEQMVEQYQLVSRQLSSLLYKSACPLLIHHSSVLIFPIRARYGWDLILLVLDSSKYSGLRMGFEEAARASARLGGQAGRQLSQRLGLYHAV